MAKAEKAYELIEESIATLNRQMEKICLTLDRIELKRKQKEERTKKWKLMKLSTNPPNPTSPPVLILTADAPESCPKRPEHEIETRTNRPEIPAPGPISQTENPCAREENVIIPHDLEISKTSIPAPKTSPPRARC